MPSSTLYTLISKALSDELICEDHGLPLTLVGRDIQLVCEECGEEDAHPLECFFENPISLMLWNSNARGQSEEWLKKNIQEDIECRLERSKSVLGVYLEELQATIARYCENILQEYSRQVDRVTRQSSKSLADLQKLNELYCSQLQQQINGNDLSLPFLTTLMEKFLSSSENPSSKILCQVKEITSTLQKFTFLNLERLTQHYQQLCDPFKWRLSNFIVNHADSEIFDAMADSIHLADKKHYVKYGEEGIAIYSYDSQAPLDMNMMPIDDCSEMNGYRIFGYNSQEIVVFSYLNPSHLEIIGCSKARFPTEISYSHPYIYYKSQNTQWKWDPSHLPQPLSKPTSSQFIKPQPSLFRLLDHKQPIQLNMENNFVTLS